MIRLFYYFVLYIKAHLTDERFFTYSNYVEAL